jgi:hypothetical protein
VTCVPISGLFDWSCLFGFNVVLSRKLSVILWLVIICFYLRILKLVKITEKFTSKKNYRKRIAAITLDGTSEEGWKVVFWWFT